MTEPIYLDNNATTPLASEVREAVSWALDAVWGNPSSAHVYGTRARGAIDRARGEVAGLLGCDADEVVFTSGGTESDNAAVLGVAGALEERGRHVVISAVEHPAVERACALLERRGFEVTRVPVGPDGRVAAAGVGAALRDDTVLVSLMHANNETGVIQPVREIAAAARERGIPVHTDAAQSLGKILVRVDDLGVDLLTIAGHKLYGPKGVGALYVRRGTPFVPLLLGAGHEAGRRAGTENVAGIVGLGAACALASVELELRRSRMAAVRDRLESELRDRLPGIVVHGDGAPRLPNTAYLAFPGTDANALVARCPEVAMGVGAACHSGRTEPSRVLRAMGVPDDLARATVRLSVGRDTTEPDVARAAGLIAEAAADARAQ